MWYEEDILSPFVKTPLQSSTRLDITTPLKREFLGSYSYDMEGGKLLVPGVAPILDEAGMKKAVGMSLKKEEGLGILYPDIHMSPTSPTIPYLLATEVCAPHFKLEGKVIADRRVLRNLVKILAGQEVISTDFQFYITLMPDKTLILTNWAENCRGVALGYGLDFERRFTKAPVWAGRASKDYKRLFAFTLGSMEVVVRGETDTIVPSVVVDLPPSGDVRERVGFLPVEKTSLPMHMECNAIELKTKTEFYLPTFDWEDTYYQMLFGGTDELILALHTFGVIKKVHRHSIQRVMERAGLSQPDAQRHLGRMIDFLSFLRKNMEEDLSAKGGGTPVAYLFKHKHTGLQRVEDGKVALWVKASQSSCSGAERQGESG